jgi:hypothetical protein
LLRLTQKIARVLQNHKIFLAYTRWILAKAVRHRGPLRLTPNGLKFDSWVNFSEYLWNDVVLPVEERKLVTTVFTTRRRMSEDRCRYGRKHWADGCARLRSALIRAVSRDLYPTCRERGAQRCVGAKNPFEQVQF